MVVKNKDNNWYPVRSYLRVANNNGNPIIENKIVDNLIDGKSVPNLNSMVTNNITNIITDWKEIMKVESPEMYDLYLKRRGRYNDADWSISKVVQPAPQPAPTSSTDTGTAGQRPGQYFPRDAVDASIDQADADAGAAAQAALDQQALSNMDMQVGQGAQRAPAQPDVGTPELNIGQGSQNAPVQGGEEELGTIDPNDVKRFGELLDKLEKGASGAAANPPAGQQASKPAAQGYKGSAGAQAIHKLNPQIKDINKIFPGQQLKMPDGSTYTVKPGDTMDKITRGMRSGAGANPPGATTSPQVMQGTMPAADPRAGRGYGTVREDDAILARIKAVKL